MERFIAYVVHAIHSPPSPAELSQLTLHLGDHAQGLQAFYRKHNGFLLYRDTLSDAAGVEAYRIQDWARATDRLHKQVRDSLEDDKEDPTGLLSSVAFATAPRSGNYFVVKTQGANAGEIFYTNHETCSKAAFAIDFDEFIRRITTDPITLLARQLGCFARYSDGSTSTQWIPDEVVTVEEKTVVKPVDD